MQNRSSTDGVLSIFEPSTLLPTQFFAALKQKAEADGERRLMLAILEDAIECYQKHVLATENKAYQLHNEAEAWFLEDDPTWLFSFVNICEVFDIHPVSLRQGLLNWKTQKLAQQQVRRTDVDMAGDSS